MKYDFNFDFLPVSTDEEDEYKIRPNLQIVKCCGNCMFFWYKHGVERRGYCRLPDPERRKNAKWGTTREEAEKTWARMHITCHCDNHQDRSKYHSIDRVEKWLERPFLPDGRLDLDADIRQTANKAFKLT
jgi:hypothetical protein